MIFQPDRDQARAFFCETWRKFRDNELLTPLEGLAAKWIAVHPEYHRLLDDPDRARGEDFSVERGRTNPFLHLGMHLALEEQLGIDQPPGIRAAFDRLKARCADEHAAQHAAMECLGAIVWEMQRGPALEPAALNEKYLTCLERKAR